MKIFLMYLVAMWMTGGAAYAGSGESVESVAPIEWVTISGGKFTMVHISVDFLPRYTEPTHDVDIKTFQMSKTDVTVAQYEECVTAGKCTEYNGRGKLDRFLS